MQFIALDVIGALLGAAAALVLGAVLVFAFSIERLGIAISVFLVVVLSAMAIPSFRKIETLVLAIAIVAFCIGVFIYGLSLPLSMWPPQ